MRIPFRLELTASVDPRRLRDAYRKFTRNLQDFPSNPQRILRDAFEKILPREIPREAASCATLTCSSWPPNKTPNFAEPLTQSRLPEFPPSDSPMSISHVIRHNAQIQVIVVPNLSIQITFRSCTAFAALPVAAWRAPVLQAERVQSSKRNPARSTGAANRFLRPRNIAMACGRRSLGKPFG